MNSWNLSRQKVKVPEITITWRGVVYMLKISQKDLVTQEVMKNLLSAHKRIADSGEVSDLIRITKYLLRLSEKREDVLIEVVSKQD